MLGIGTVIDLEAAPDRPIPREQAFELAKRSDSRSSGRPLQLTTEIAEQIARNVAEGSFLTVACGKAGVNYDSVQQWLRRAVADENAGLDTVFVRFAQVIAHAQQEAEASAVAALQRGGDGKYKDWRAQAWWLERRHKDRWSLPKEQANQGLTLQLSNEQVASLVEALRVARATDVTPAVLTIDSTTIGSGNK